MFKTLLVDIDFTTANLGQHYFDVYNSTYNQSISFDRNTFNVSHFSDITMPITGNELKEEKKRQWHIFGQKNFWKNIPVMEGAAAALDFLHQRGVDIYFLTVPSWSAKQVFFKERCQWVEKNFPFIGERKIIFAENKSLFDPKRCALVDDRAENLNTFPGITIKINWKYNEFVAVDYEFEKWEEWLEGGSHVIDSLYDVDLSI